MATRTETVITDDYDAAFPAAASDGQDIQTVPFGFAGEFYEIDLSAQNRQHLRDALADFIAAARPRGKAAAQKPAAARPPRPSEKTVAALVREWARAHDIDVPPRGRVPKTVIAQWESATGQTATEETS